MVGSVLVVLTVWDRLGTLRSLETRDAIAEGLQDPPFSGTGLDVEGVITILHTASMVTAGCAAAMAILGWHVLQRNVQARLVLTILAVPLFVSGLASGGFLSSLVAAAVVVLWMQPARQWYATGSWTMPSRESRAATPPAQQPTPPQTPWQPGPQAPEQRHEPQPVAQGAPSRPFAAPYPDQAPALAKPPAQRPGALVVGAVLTFVFAGLTALLALLSVLLVVLSPGLVMDELERQSPDLLEQGVTQSAIVTSTAITGSVTILWSVLAMVLAGFALAGSEKARRALVVCAGASAVVLFAASLGPVFPIVPAIGALFTVLQLRRPEVRQWCSLRRGRGEMVP